MEEVVWSHDFDICRMMEVEWKHMSWVYNRICNGKW